MSTVRVVWGTGGGPTGTASYDAALADAGVHNYNLMTVSSVLPRGATVESVGTAPDLGPVGGRLTVVQARTTVESGPAVAGIGWATAVEGGLFYEDSGSDRGAVVDRLERGLARARDSAGHYDRFRHRIVFPVVDIWRNIRAFGGRTMADDDDTPKYMNSPETPFYTKGEHLYGLHVAKKHFQNAGYALVVEGNFDVLALHAAGIRTAVAPMGTALTAEQADLLSRYTRTVVVAFDGDDAGADATHRCLPALQEAGLEGRVIRFDETDDPDSFVRREGDDALDEKVDDATPIVTWALESVLARAGAPVEQKITSLERAADILDDVENDSVREECIQDISRRLEIRRLDSDPEEVLQKFLEDPEAARETREALAHSGEPLDLESAEASLLSVLLEQPEWTDHFLESGYDIMLASEQLAEFLKRLHRHVERHDAIKLDLLLEQIDGARMRETVVEAVDETIDADESQQLGFYRDCLRTIQQKYAERGIRRIERRMDDLNFREDREEFEKLNGKLRKFQQLKQRSVSSPTGNH